MSILDRLLEKRKVKNISELHPEDRAMYEGWRAILAKEEATTEDIKEFCKSQIALIENKWADFSAENAKKAELIPYHTAFNMILVAIDAPKAPKLQLEEQLRKMVEEPDKGNAKP